MKATDYESGVPITARNKEQKDAEPCTLVLMSNKDESLVNRVMDDDTTEQDQKIINSLLQMLLMASSADGHQSFVGFVDVDSEESLRKMATFPAHMDDIREYNFSDPQKMPTYEEVELV